MAERGLPVVLARALRFLGKNAIPRRWRNDAGYLEPAGRLSDLAEDLFARFEQEGTAADLDAAIDATQQAADLTPSRHPSRAVHLSNLGAACLARFELTGRATDLETAIRVGMQAIDLTPQDHPSRAGRLSNLANALRARFGQAACAMTDGRPDLAVELLEQGRSVLWTQVLTMRGDLSRLAENAPGLAERLNTIRAGLDCPLPGPQVGRHAGSRLDEPRLVRDE
jgi:tetratricopeptide (TPR) repeat protein